MAAKNIDLLLVDDHALMRKGIKALLSQESSITIIGEATTGESAVQMVREKKPDIVLMDIKMTGIGGQEATRRILRSCPDVRVIVLTACDQDPHPENLLKMGASGFLSKGCSAEELIEAIHCVSQGKSYISANIAQELALRKATQTEKKEPHEGPSALSHLSAREMQTLLMIGNGLKVRQIAEKLMVTPKTVNTYRYRLYHKLNVKTDVELTHIAIRYHLVDIDKRPSYSDTEE